ncbi:MAG: helix-turn-helix domain-containing protein [Acidobacteria bacterium]|jgi:ribosome-binding protein aMBF1 (putative translation factor)|nr:helix-turn-helix domain-containing protein [Acidobacteriota bacterium]
MIIFDEEINKNMFSNQAIGERFRQARIFLGISVERLALLWETSIDDIIKVEKGELCMPTEWVYQLAKLFDINANWLLMGVEHITIEKTQAFKILVAFLLVKS